VGQHQTSYISALYIFTVAGTSHVMCTSVFIVCTLYSSGHVAFVSFSCKCHEGNCSDVISNVGRQSTYRNSEWSISSIVFEKNSKHLCQPMDRMYSCLELKVFTVKSCQLPVRRPEFSLTFWGFAGHFNP